MTTIAYRDGVIAADTLITWNGRRESFVGKIDRYGPLLAGAAGSASMARAFFDWLARGAIGDPPRLVTDKYELEAVIVMPDDRLVQFNGETCFYSRAPFYAMGSGARVAMGAMATGASAEEAVRFAAQLDTATGGDIHVLRRDTEYGVTCGRGVIFGTDWVKG